MGSEKKTPEHAAEPSSSWEGHHQDSRTIDTHATLRKTGVGILLLVVGFFGAVSQLFSAQLNSQMENFNIKLAEFMGTSYDGSPLCSGHGVSISNGKCLCDLGFAGIACSEAVSTELTDPVSNSVLIVSEQFGPVNPNDALEADSTYALALHLKDAGYTVSVLYVGEDAPMFWKTQRDLLKDGITLTKLNNIGLNYGSNPVEARSYEVYQYLIRQPDQYSVVHFDAGSGAGYYTLLAQKQGLICSKTRFIVGVDKLSPVEMLSIEKNDPEFVVTDVDTLKLDYITKKTVELADTIVIASKFLLGSLRENSWNFETSGTHVIDMIPSSEISGPSNGKNVKAKEFAFVGPLTTLNGIKVFCESIDNIAGKLGKARVKVSFVGLPSTIDDVPSEEWIDIYASNWHDHGIKWNLVKARDTKDILTYLSAESGRVAVLPSLYEPSSIIGQELLYGGFPFVASSQSALNEMIIAEDRQNAIVSPNVDDLTRRLKEILRSPVPIPRPVGFRSSSIESWLDLHSQILNDDSLSCVRKFEDSREYPLVSVVLVHHNRGHYLKQAVASIEAQTYPNIEVVLVDDGSTDQESIKTMETITWGWWENKGWKVIREKNKYLGAARNTGVKHAAGKYIVFMDDDDMAKPHQVETLVKVAINRAADVVTSGHDVFTGKHTPFTGKSQKRYLPIGPAVLVGMLENVFGDSKMLVSRDVFVGSGGFTEDYGVGFEDYEFLAKMALKGTPMEAVSEPLNWYRRHDTAMSYQTNLKANQLRMLRPYVDANENSSPQQKALLEHTQEIFFNRHGIRAFGVDSPRDRSNQTSSIPSLSSGSSRRPSTSRPSTSRPSSSRPTISSSGRPSLSSASYSSRPSGSTISRSFSFSSGSFSRSSRTSVRSTVTETTFIRSTPVTFISEISSSFEVTSSKSLPLFTETAGPSEEQPEPTRTPEDPTPPPPPPKIECGPLADCAGLCPTEKGYGYNIDCSGKCVPKDNFKRHDRCYVCGGNGMSCVDCQGVVNGTAVEDLCGVCDGTGSTCNLYVANEPPIIPNEPFVNFTIVGAGFVNDAKHPNNSFVFIDGEEVPRERLTFVQQQWIVVTFEEPVVLEDEFNDYMVEVRQAGQDFDKHKLTLYDPETSFIDSIDPFRMNVRTKNDVTLTGSFLSFPDMVCVYENGSQNGVTSPIVLKESNGTQIAECVDPISVRNSGFAPVHVLYSKPLWRTPYYRQEDNLRVPYYLDERDKIGIYVFDTMPEVKVAMFADSGQAIIVEFKQQIMVVDSDVYAESGGLVKSPVDFGDVVSCSSVFDSANRTLYTANEDCTLTMPTTNTLKLSFAFGSTVVVPGDYLYFKPNSLIKRLCEYCNAIEGRTYLYPPYSPQQPTVIINGPTIIGPCPDLTLDLSQVSGSMGRSWKDVSISMFTNVIDDNANTTALEAHLDALAREAVSGSTSLVIPADYLPLGEFVFTITYKNYLEGTGVGGLEVIKQENEIPYVVLSSDNGFQNLQVRHIQALRARALLACPDTSSQDVRFIWSDERGFVGPDMVSLSVLTFPKFAFRPNDTYSFTLSYGYVGQDTVTVQYAFRTQEKDVLTTNVGPSRTIGAENSVRVTPIIRSDSYVEPDLTTFSAFYLCSTYPLFGDCISEETGEIFDMGIMATGFDLTGQVKPGQGYIFTAIFTNEMTGSVGWAKPAVLKITDGITPVIDVFPSVLAPGYLEILSIDTEIPEESVSSIDNIEFQWSSPSKCGGSVLNDFDLEESHLATSINGKNLKFLQGVLQPDDTYCIEVSAKDTETNAVGKSNIVVKISDVPGGGTCFTFGDTEGIAFVDAFTVQCIGWSAQSGPLKYEFSIKAHDGSPDDEGWTVLSPAGPSSSFTQYLPVGVWKILTSVYDGTYSVNLDLPIVLFEITESAVAKRDARATELNFITQAMEDYTHTLDLYRAHTALGIGAAALPDSIAFSQSLPLLRKMIEFLSVIIDTGNWYIDQDVAAPFAGALLKSLVGTDYRLPTDTSEGVFTLLKRIVMLSLATEPENCYTSDISNDFFDVVDGVLSSLNATNEFSSLIAETYDEVVTALKVCVTNEMLCGEDPYEFEGKGFDITIGIQDAQSIEQICDYKVMDFMASAFPAVEGCVAVSCGHADLYGILPSTLRSNYADMSRKASFAKFYQDQEIEIKNGKVEGVIKDEHFSAYYPMDDFFNGNFGGFKPVIGRIDLNGSDFNTATVDEDDVVLTSVEDGIYYFEAKEAGTYALFAGFNEEIVVPPPKPTITQAPPEPTGIVECPGQSDCAGNCPGSLLYNKYAFDDCGSCTLKTEPTQRDQCGVCNGNGKSCLDCAGIVNGTHIIDDVCFACIDPSQGHVPECFALAGIEPSFVNQDVGQYVTLYGAGFDDKTVIEINGVLNLTSDSVSIPAGETSGQFMTYKFGANQLPDLGEAVYGVVYLKAYHPNEPPTKSKPLYYYNSNKSFLDSIDHSKKVFINMVDDIRIHGSNIVDTNKIEIDGDNLHPACVVLAPEGTIYGDMHVESPEKANCFATFSQDGDAHVFGLYSKPRFRTPKYPDINDYNRPEYFIRETNDLSFKIYQHAPEISRAYFADNGASIFVDFDKAITIINDTQAFIDQGLITSVIWTTSTPCVYAFKNSAEKDSQLWRDGNESDCIVSKVGPSTLRLSFKGQFTLDKGSSPIVPEKDLTVQDNAIVTYLATYSDASEGSHIVEGPAHAPLPNVQVKAPILIGACVDFHMDLSASFGSAGRNWKEVLISFTGETTTIDQQARTVIEESLTPQAAAVVAGDTTEVTILKENIPENIYRWNITFVNFLGGADSQILFLNKINADDVPYIVLTSDNGFEDVDNSELQVLRATSTPIVGCGKQGAVSFKWSNTQVTSRKLLQSQSPTKIEIAAEKAERAALVLTPYTLQPNNQYDFRVTCAYVDGGNPYDFDMNIFTRRDVIFANAGASRTVGTENDIVMSASIINTAYPVFDPELFECTWKCIVMENGVEGNDCISAQDGQSILHENMVGCTPSITGHLAKGNYKFTVVVRNVETQSVRADGDPSHLKVLEGTVPLLHITANMLSPGSYSQSYHILAEVDESTIQVAASEMKYEWQSMEECHGTQYVSMNLIQDVSTLTDPKARNLKFVPGALSAATTYCFRIVAIDPSNPGSPGESSIIVKVRDAPFGGVCKTNLNQGGAFDAEFQFSCSGWVTDSLSYPLNYVFNIRRIGGTQLIPIGPKGASALLKTMLASGNFEFIIIVVDKALSVNADQQTGQIEVVDVAPSKKAKRGTIDPPPLHKRQNLQSGTVKAISFVQAAQQNFVLTKDSNAAMVAIVVALSGINTDVTGDDHGALFDVCFVFVEAIMLSGELHVDPDRSAPVLAAISVSSTLSTKDLTTTRAEKVFTLARNTTSQSLLNAPGTCFNNEASDKFLNAMESVIFSIAEKDTPSQYVSQLFDEALKDLDDCVSNLRICGQSAYNHIPFGGFQFTTSIVDSALTQQFCDFTIADFASLSATNGCVRVMCTEHLQNGLINRGEVLTKAKNVDANVVDIGPTAKRIKIFDQNGVELTLQAKIRAVIGTKLLEQTLADEYGLSNFNPVNKQGLGHEPIIIQLIPGEISYLPEVSGSSMQIFDSSSVSDGVLLQFEAAAIGDFAVAIKKLEAPPVNTNLPPSQTDSPTTPPGGEPPVEGGDSGMGGIIGGVVGAVVGVVLIAGILFAVKRSKQKKNETPKVIPTPPPAEVAVANGDAVIINMDPEPGFVAQPIVPPTEEEPQIVRTRDPALLPNYQLPPSYDAYMSAAEEGRDLGPEDYPQERGGANTEANGEAAETSQEQQEYEGEPPQDGGPNQGAEGPPPGEDVANDGGGGDVQ